MIRSKTTRAILAASFCLLASAQSAMASSASLKQLQAMDINDSHTPAGRAYKAEMKRTGETCPFANKRSRFEVASISKDAPAASRGSEREVVQ